MAIRKKKKISRPDSKQNIFSKVLMIVINQAKRHNFKEIYQWMHNIRKKSLSFECICFSAEM